MVIGPFCDKSALDSDWCNMIYNWIFQVCKFSPTRPNKRQTFYKLEDPGTKFTRALGSCVIFTVSWTVVRSSRLLIPVGCPWMTSEGGCLFVTHVTHLYFALIQYNRFSVSKAWCLWRQRHALWEWRGWREVFWCFATFVTSRRFFVLSTVVCCISTQDCHSQVDGKCWP